MIRLTRTLYTATATAEGGRDGRTSTDDGRLDVKLAVPAEMGGTGGDGTNPEQLFAAGYASCFHSALKLVAAKRNLDPSDSTVTAKVGIGPGEGMPGFGLAVELHVTLPRIDDPEVARTTVERAHQVCPYSNAIRDNVAVELTLA